MDVTLDDLARLVGGTVSGDGKTVIRAVNGIKEAGPGDVTFLANSKYAPLLATTKASAVILAEGTSAPLPAVTVRNPDLAFAKVAEHLSGGAWRPPPGVHATAVVSKSAVIGRNVWIGPGTVVEDGASIGDNSALYAQVYIGRETVVGPDALIYPQVVVREKCRIGARVIVHIGAVIGSDGFGYATDKGVHHKIPQVGIVVIEDDVELGANVTIDRARFGARGSEGQQDRQPRPDRPQRGPREGSSSSPRPDRGQHAAGELRRDGGPVGSDRPPGHRRRRDHHRQSGLTKDVAPKAVMSGSPASDRRTHLKELAALSKLPEALQEIRRLRQEIEELRKKTTS